MVDHNGGAVFARESRARAIAVIHRALRAKSWGDFRRAMPADEYERVMSAQFDELEEERPADFEEFWGVNGSSEGDYPPWLQPEMQIVLPIDLLDRHGVLRDTFVSGSYFEILEHETEALASALRDRGFEVERADELPFW